jgi:hypothetical protein
MNRSKEFVSEENLCRQYKNVYVCDIKENINTGRSVVKGRRRKFINVIQEELYRTSQRKQSTSIRKIIR